MHLGLVLPEMPATKPATNENATFRGACFTSYILDDILELDKKLSYIAYAKETCPSTGREHLQGFAYSLSAMRLTGWKKVLPSGSHIERMQGTFSQNEKYCSKEGTYKELGVRPMENGHRRGDLLVKEIIDNNPNTTLMEIYEETSEKCALIYSKSFEQYREHKRAKTIKGDHTAPEVHYIYGAPGSGKSRFVRESESDVYDVPEGFQWFNGYTGQDAVLFDNFEGPERNRATFLKLIDRYPIQVPIKGGFTWWKPKRIYITSVIPPDMMARNFTDVREFYRRVTLFKHVHDFTIDQPNGVLSQT